MKTIPLTKGFVALVDDEDYESLSQVPWHCTRGYAATSARTKKFRRLFAHVQTAKNIAFMHRVVSLCPPHLEVDHESRDTLDNRRNNLRWATDQQNQGNSVSPSGTSKFKGIYWEPRRDLWIASVMVDRKHQYLGGFSTEEEAARMYDRAAFRIFGDFARLNFPADKQKHLLAPCPREPSSPYVGVSIQKHGIVAQARVNGKQVYLGSFETEYDAALYRDHYIEKHNLRLRMNF